MKNVLMQVKDVCRASLVCSVICLICLFFFLPSVIPNTLSVSPKSLPSTVPEGSDITLTCNVTRQLTHPTYLSVTWLVKKGTTSEEILTFGPEGDVSAGPKFARRYTDGGIRLVPGKNGLFELVISRVTLSDEGSYECNGTEWTHENGGKWIKIIESTREMGTVSVTPTGKRKPDSRKCIASTQLKILVYQYCWSILANIHIYHLVCAGH